MKYYSLIALFLLAVLFPVPAQEKVNTENFSLSCETRGEKLIVDLTGPGTGWLGFGLEDNLIIVWMEDMLGLPMGEDHFGSLEEHRNDMLQEGSQDIQVLEGNQDRDRTAMTFSIPLNSDDELDTTLERGKTYRLFLGAGRDDDSSKPADLIFEGEITIP